MMLKRSAYEVERFESGTAVIHELRDHRSGIEDGGDMSQKFLPEQGRIPGGRFTITTSVEANDTDTGVTVSPYSSRLLARVERTDREVSEYRLPEGVEESTATDLKLLDPEHGGRIRYHDVTDRFPDTFGDGETGYIRIEIEYERAETAAWFRETFDERVGPIVSLPGVIERFETLDGTEFADFRIQDDGPVDESLRYRRELLPAGDDFEQAGYRFDIALTEQRALNAQIGYAMSLGVAVTERDAESVTLDLRSLGNPDGYDAGVYIGTLRLARHRVPDELIDDDEGWYCHLMTVFDPDATPADAPVPDYHPAG